MSHFKSRAVTGWLVGPFVMFAVVLLYTCFFVRNVGAEANFLTSTVSGLNNAYHIVSADINNDNIPDLAVTGWDVNQVTILLGNGLGGFTTTTTLAAGVHPNFIATGNLNGIGGIDMAVTNGGGQRDITLFFNDGSGTSWTTSTLPLGNDADVSSVVAANFTSPDSDIDLFIVKDSGVTTDFFEVWQGNGAGLFTEITSASGNTGSQPIFVASSDLNGDAKPDMIVVNYLGNSLTVLLGNGDGTFSEASGSPIAVGSLPRSVSTGNLNGDAYADLIVPNIGDNTLTILLGNGDGTFASGMSLSVGGQPASAAIADFDDDGFKDIAVSRWSANTLSIYYGNGDGTFKSTPTNVPVGTNPFFVVAADFDRDGKTDLAVTNYASNDMSILLNKTGVCLATPVDIVLWWSGDGHPFDLLSANNGTMMNGATYAAGKVGQAFSFDGTNDYVDLPDGASNLINDSAGSITAWVNAVSVGDNDIVVAFGSGINGQGIGIGIFGNVRIYHHTGTYDWQSTTPISANEWTMLTYTWDTTTERIYKNGVFSESRPRSGPSNFHYVPGHARIGHGFWGDSANAFPGLIDEVAVYSRTLSAQEIAAIYNAGSVGKCKPCFMPPSGLISWWIGDGNANDIIGGNDGTLQGGAAFASGKVGQAFSLDGVDDHVIMPHNANLNPTNISVGAWIKAKNTGGYQLIIDKGHGSGNSSGWVAQIRPDDKIDFCYGNGSLDYSGACALSTSTLTDDAWHHVAGTLDGATIKIYIDGILEDSPVYSGTPQSNGQDVYMGAAWWGEPRFFSGLIDEVQIFSRSLSNEEIAAIHGAGSSGVCIPADTKPEQFTFTDQTGVALNTVFESNDITVAGINASSPISITGGEYSINGGAYTLAAGTVENGQTVKVRQTSSSSHSTTTDATLTVGGVSDTFSVTTISQYLLTVTKTGTGEGMVTPSTGSLTWTGNTGSGSYSSGTLVTLTAQASAGSAFESFTGCGSSSGNICEVVMTSARNVTAAFRAVSAIKLLSPGGGPIATGSSHTIQWEAPAQATKFSLKYSIDGGLTWKPVVSGTVTGSTYNWTVPLQAKNRKACLVKVTGYDANNRKIGSDISDPFAIHVIQVTSPNGGEGLISGSSFPITWITNTPAREVASVTIQYTSDGGVTWKQAGTIQGSNPGTYGWTPSVSKTKVKCKVKVILKDAQGVSLGNDLSDAVFTINAEK